VTPPRTAEKHLLPTEDANGVIDLEPTPKKKRKFSETDLQSPTNNKKQRLESDVILVDGPQAPEADYILIDDD
jgi:ubiquitin-like 1-activating enzyme E1 B